MSQRKGGILFDKRDHLLLSIINEVLDGARSNKEARRLLFPYLHPHGIKEMVETIGFRIAYAIIHLLESLETGGVDERLSALRTVRDEVLNAAVGPMPRNTARVLLEIMKELVRAHGNYEVQIRLARDFRNATTGSPRIIREQLKRFHLLEMSEEWNQISFDDHVHDANTKGRKSSSHLIMDAWIKGIRRLRVIYYNYLEPRFAIELLEAAEIMGIELRIGIEFNTLFRDRYVQIIWVPRGFRDSQDFLCFLAEPDVMNFMAEGRKISEYQREYVLSILREFNRTHREAINKQYGFIPPVLDEKEFIFFVRTGQASLVHLAEFIHERILPSMREHALELKSRYETAEREDKVHIEDLVSGMNRLDPDEILEKFLHPDMNPHVPDPNIPGESDKLPGMLKLSPRGLLDRLTDLHPSYRTTLNLSNLKAEDVLEILYDCEGRISRLEIFNLKDFSAGKTGHIPAINELQQALNKESSIELKRIIGKLIEKIRLSDYLDRDDRLGLLNCILHDIEAFKAYYKGKPLKSRIGSDSTGRSPRVHGMGLVIGETLPAAARREVRRSRSSWEVIPIKTSVFRRTVHTPRPGAGILINSIFRLSGYIPFLKILGETRHEEWVAREETTRLEEPGNIVTLGGYRKYISNDISIAEFSGKDRGETFSWRYLNSNLKNILKVVVGFIPAFLTFYLTKEWWVLAYFGAFIWFGITGLRNILQSVLGGGGIHRSPLIGWHDFLKWQRITDSLLFTGFSVPLLDYLVKTLLLDRWWGITTATNPTALYTIIALVNGLYLSGHNILRGFPRAVVFGNFFRTLLSIPIAIGLNVFAGGILMFLGYSGVEDILQKWAAIISKAASDFVAGIIEGTSDRYQNIHIRLKDYKDKLAQLYDVYSRLEMLFPESNVLDLLEHPDSIEGPASTELKDYRKIIIIISLDLLYFWMYKPRARDALRSVLSELSTEERQILLVSQSVLYRQRDITLFFADGLVGKQFSRALSFYLEQSQGYLGALRELVA